jgi:hypothetical protein
MSPTAFRTFVFDVGSISPLSGFFYKIGMITAIGEKNEKQISS